MASNEAARRRWRGARSSRSRTTSDFEIFRPRDSASISATSGSGNRTVRVFTQIVYYTTGGSAIQTDWVLPSVATVRFAQLLPRPRTRSSIPVPAGNLTSPPSEAKTTRPTGAVLPA
jgi:hypothetical protein